MSCNVKDCKNKISWNSTIAPFWDVCDEHNVKLVCCDTMKKEADWFSCEKDGLTIHDNDYNSVPINFCPWCGKVKSYGVF